MLHADKSLKGGVIVGAGMSGLVMAIYLAQANYKVKVFEKMPDYRVSNFPSGRSKKISNRFSITKSTRN